MLGGRRSWASGPVLYLSLPVIAENRRDRYCFWNIRRDRPLARDTNLGEYFGFSRSVSPLHHNILFPSSFSGSLSLCKSLDIVLMLISNSDSQLFRNPNLFLGWKIRASRYYLNLRTFVRYPFDFQILLVDYNISDGFQIVMWNSKKKKEKINLNCLECKNILNRMELLKFVLLIFISGF